MRFPIAVFACLGIASAEVAGSHPRHSEPQRIVGGSVAQITQYPFSVSLIYSQIQVTFVQYCGGSILNQRSVLTAANCFWNTGMVPATWRARVGSTFANSGGVVHFSQEIMNHPGYNPSFEDNDFSILRLSTFIQFTGNTVLPGAIAGPAYNLLDNQIVWAIGWGSTWPGAGSSEELRHVQIWTVNQQLCAQRFASQGFVITNNMLCSGYLNVGGRDQCYGDNGSPLLHNNVIVGIRSWGIGCADPYFPGVNARVSAGSNWIQAMA